MLTAPTETYHPLWTPVLDAVRADALDCVQANIAAIADQLGGTGSHIALGAELRFTTEAGPDGVPRVASSIPHRLADAHDLLGLRVAQRWDGVDGGRLRALVTETGPLYVIADAHTLAWTPYAGRTHTEHTFILSTSDTVADAYHDETPWGPCRPGVWRIPPTEFDGMIRTATALRFAIDPVPRRPGVLAANARAMTEAQPAIDAYLAAEHGDRLVLDVWLLGRSRLLHTAWLAGQGRPGDDEFAAHAKDWLTLAGRTYVAHQLARRTRTVPTAVLDELGRLLHRDVAIAQQLAAAEPATAPGADQVRGTVLAAIGEVLRIDERAVLGAATMRDLPNYNSFRLVDIIERIETVLDVELDADDLTARSLHDVDSLCAIFGRRSG